MKKNKQIVLTYKDKEYTLEYDRNSVTSLESMGFIGNQMVDKPATMLPLAFKGAFIKHHRFLSEQIIDEIFENIEDKSGLINALADMIKDTYLSLTTSEENEKNASWKMI